MTFRSRPSPTPRTSNPSRIPNIIRSTRSAGEGRRGGSEGYLHAARIRGARSRRWPDTPGPDVNVVVTSWMKRRWRGSGPGTGRVD